MGPQKTTHFGKIGRFTILWREEHNFRQRKYILLVHREKISHSANSFSWPKSVAHVIGKKVFFMVYPYGTYTRRKKTYLYRFRSSKWISGMTKFLSVNKQNLLSLPKIMFFTSLYCIVNRPIFPKWVVFALWQSWLGSSRLSIFKKKRDTRASATPNGRL